jgi:MFS family permease
MDWKDIGPIVGSSAPLIGKLIGVGVSFIPGIGPIAGPIIGPAIGSILAKQFGVAPTPEAVSTAIAANGGVESEIVKAKLAAATEEVKAQYAWATAVETGQLKLEEVQVSQVNETMRAELQVDDPLKTWWRPIAGYIADFGMLGVIIMLLIALAMAMFFSDGKPLAQMQEAWPLIALVIGMPLAVVGVAIWKRSDEKIAATNAIASGNAVLSTDPKAPSKQPDNTKLVLAPSSLTKPIPAKVFVTPPRSDLSQVDPRERVQTG